MEGGACRTGWCSSTTTAMRNWWRPPNDVVHDPQESELKRLARLMRRARQWTACGREFASMLERINDMPEGTIGLAAKGAVTAADCEQMLLPMVAGRPNSSERTGVLLLFGPEFDDFEAGPVDGYAQFAFHRWHE